MEPEPPPRGFGSRGAVDLPGASSGRDPGVWRGVGPGSWFAQNVPGLRGKGAAAALSQVGASASGAGPPSGHPAAPRPSGAQDLELGGVLLPPPPPTRTWSQG